MEQGREKGR